MNYSVITSILVLILSISLGLSFYYCRKDKNGTQTLQSPFMQEPGFCKPGYHVQCVKGEGSRHLPPTRFDPQNPSIE